MNPRLALPLLAAVLPLAAAAADVRLIARESVTLPFPGATAAFAVDASLVEVSLRNGELVILGRRAGQTFITVVGGAGTKTLEVQVAPAAPFVPAGAPVQQDPGASSWELRHDSATGRSTAGVSAGFASGEHRARVRVDALHEPGAPGYAARKAIPWASVEISSPGRSIVLLDKFVQASPLTLDGAVVRGAHLDDGTLSADAGLVSASPLDDLLFPSRAERAAQFAWRMPQAGGLAITPRLALLPDSATGTRAVASIGVESGSAKDALHWKAEAGFGGKPGVALDLDYRDSNRELWVKGIVKPSGFASLSASRPPGSSLDAAWSEHLSQATTASATLSANRLDIQSGAATGASLRGELRHRLDKKVELIAAANGGFYQREGDEALRRAGVSLGAAYEGQGFGAAGTYRYQQTSAASPGGHGARVSLHGTGSSWRGHIYADAQQQAATAGLLLQERPDLARAAAELEISASSPEELLQRLQANGPLLAARGVELGGLRTSPLRLQGGLDFSWKPTAGGATEVGVRVIADMQQGVASRRDSFVGSLYAKTRVFRDTDVELAYMRSSLRDTRGASDTQGSLQVALRSGFSTNSLPGIGSRSISGTVLRDDETAKGVPMAGVDIVLDRGRRTTTDAQGRFSFDDPGGGQHRVEAFLPGREAAYFTSPSAMTLEPGGQARFALSFVAARVGGRVLSDAGLPVPGASILVENKGASASAITDSSGAYRTAVAAGAAKVSLDASSLPPGYELRGSASHQVELVPQRPVEVDFIVRAQRALQARVTGAAGVPVTVTVAETSQQATTDTAGQVMLRGLPAGKLTLVARGAFGERREEVVMPAEPGVVRGIVIGEPRR